MTSSHDEPVIGPSCAWDPMVYWAMVYATNTQKLMLRDAVKLLDYHNLPIQHVGTYDTNMTIRVFVWVEGPFATIKNKHESGRFMPFIEGTYDCFVGLRKALEYCHAIIQAQHARLADANDYM